MPSTIPVGAVGFDCAAPLTSERIRAMLRDRPELRFAVRYLPLPGNAAGADLDADEIAAILGAGLGLMAVQRVRTGRLDANRERLGHRRHGGGASRARHRPRARHERLD